MFKNIIKNWKTTSAGCAALPMIIEGITEKNVSKALLGLGILLTGLFAKDSDKTGTGL